MSLLVLLTMMVAIALLLVATVFLFMPQTIPALEEKLNAPWGDNEILSIRLGTSKENALETLLNKPVLNQSIYWDNWTKKHPRLTGIVLYGFVVILLIMLPIF